MSARINAFLLHLNSTKIDDEYRARGLHDILQCRILVRLSTGIFMLDAAIRLNQPGLIAFVECVA